MAMPKIPVIDCSLNIPPPDPTSWAVRMGPLFRDEDSRKVRTQHAAGYMFKTPPLVPRSDTTIDELLATMDGLNIAKAVTRVSFDDEFALAAVREHPDRFIPLMSVDPNLGMETVRLLERGVRELGVKAAHLFPCGVVPQVPANDKRVYPIYAKCIELDIPIFVNMGVPGPRVPFAPQDVALVDEVCWFFPELRFVFKHGCEPWTDLACKLMLKWPNLYYCTSAFAPKHYPKAVINFANTRGADKVMYAGYFPDGLSLERIFSELPSVPFRDHVWPKFLYENAARVLRLDS